jgi:hypothetical protein
LLALRASHDPELKVIDRQGLLSEMTWQASQEFEAGEFRAAERSYRDILREFPQDCLARFMIAESAAQAELAAGSPAQDALP